MATPEIELAHKLISSLPHHPPTEQESFLFNEEKWKRLESIQTTKQFSQNQHDTFEITEIYLKRPTCLAQLKMSQWFCLAHGLKDWDLQNAASLGDCKRQMINKGYVFFDLEPLVAFNQKCEKLGKAS